MIQKQIFSFCYSRRLSRLKQGSSILKSYLRGFVQRQAYIKVHSGLITIQRQIKMKLASLAQQRRLKNLLLLQAYIKKTVCRKNKEKVFAAVAKIVSLMRRYRLRKNIKKYAFINSVKNTIIDRAWKTIVVKHR